MTNALAAFQSAKPAAKFQAVLGAAPQDSLADGIGSSYAVLHYKGKVWTLRYRGVSHVVSRPDDGTPANAIEVIILNQAKTKSKSFYPKWDPNQADGERPICASLDGITPDADVQQKQADACAICPKNVWYTAADGRNKRDCSDYKRLAVLIHPATTARLLGKALVEPVFLRIPPASLNDLASFGERMHTMGWHYASFLTQISFDPASEFPKFTFKEIRPLTDDEADVVLPLINDAQTIRIIGNDTVAIAGQARLAAPQQSPVAVAPVAAPVVQQPVQPVTAPITAAPAPAPAPFTPTPQIIESTVVASDADMDAKIKAILGG